jgi:hypothetical protein
MSESASHANVIILRRKCCKTGKDNPKYDLNINNACISTRCQQQDFQPAYTQNTISQPHAQYPDYSFILHGFIDYEVTRSWPSVHLSVARNPSLSLCGVSLGPLACYSVVFSSVRQILLGNATDERISRVAIRQQRTD